MSDAPERRVARAEGQAPGQAIRFAIVVLCVLGTGCVYVGCIVVVVGGHVQTLFDLIPWLAVTALGTIFVVTVCAALSASHERLRKRHRVTGARIRRLAAIIESSETSSRAAAKKQLIQRLDVTRDALSEIIELHPSVRDGLVAGGVASRVERELDPAGAKWHRVSAAGVLGLLRADSSIRPLSRALADPDVDVAYAAAQALAVFQSPIAYATLVFAMCRSSLPAARIAGLLEEFHCPQARELIERRAEAEDPQVRYWAAYLLGSLADPRSAPVVEKLARDPEEDVRANAAESLASFPNPALLGRLLADESWVVRSHAAKAAGASGQTTLSRALADLLEDRSWWVRQNAMIALAGFGDAAVPALLAKLRCSDRFARNKAAEALVRSGYANTQIGIVATGAAGHAEARAVLIDVGRAEAVGAILSGFYATSDPDARKRLIGVLQDIGTEQANSALEQLADAAAIDPVEQLQRLEQLVTL